MRLYRYAYFDNAAEGQNKAAEWVDYIFPIP